MSTRLYPKTKDGNILEILAFVPHGTYQNLMKAKELYKSTDEFLESLYEKGNESMLHLENFMTFGWGRVSFPNNYQFNSDSDCCCGSETDIKKVLDILDLNGICVDQHLITEGLEWS